MWGESREEDGVPSRYETFTMEKTITSNDLDSDQCSVETTLTTDRVIVEERNGANQKIERLKRENDELLAENNLIARQLYLAKHNASLRVVNILTDILNWVDIQATSSYGRWNAIPDASRTFASNEASASGSPRIASPPEQPPEDRGPPLHLRDLMSPNPSRRAGAGNSLSKEERESFLGPSTPDRVSDYYERKHTYTRSSPSTSEPAFRVSRRDRSLTPDPITRSMTISKKEKQKIRSKTPEPRMGSTTVQSTRRKSKRSKSPRMQVIARGETGLKSPRSPRDGFRDTRSYMEESRREERRSPRQDDLRYLKEERYRKEESKSPREIPGSFTRSAIPNQEELAPPPKEVRSYREENRVKEKRQSPRESSYFHKSHKNSMSRKGDSPSRKGYIRTSTPASPRDRVADVSPDGWRTPRVSTAYSRRENSRRSMEYSMQDVFDEPPRLLSESQSGGSPSTREKFLTSRKVQDVYDDGLKRTFKETYNSKGTEKEDDGASVSSREFTTTRTDYRSSPSGQPTVAELPAFDDEEPIITTAPPPVKQLFRKSPRNGFFDEQSQEFSNILPASGRLGSPGRYESSRTVGSTGRFESPNRSSPRKSSPGRSSSRDSPTRSSPRRSSPRKGSPQRGSPQRGSPGRGSPPRRSPERGSRAGSRSGSRCGSPMRRSELGDATPADPGSPPFARSSPQTVYNKALHNNKKVPNTKRLIGEVAFQLDRRILNYVFASGLTDSSQDRRRFYGYIIQNIPDKILRESIDRVTGDINYQKRATLHYRYQYILDALRPMGYDVDVHSDLSVELVNKYGLLPLPSSRRPGEGIGPTAKEVIEDIILQVAPPEEQPDIIIMLNCLAFMAEQDNKPMLMFN